MEEIFRIEAQVSSAIILACSNDYVICRDHVALDKVLEATRGGIGVEYFG